MPSSFRRASALIDISMGKGRARAPGWQIRGVIQSGNGPPEHCKKGPTPDARDGSHAAARTGAPLAKFVPVAGELRKRAVEGFPLKLTNARHGRASRLKRRGLSRPSPLGSHCLAILSGMRGSTLAIVFDDRSPAHDKAKRAGNPLATR